MINESHTKVERKNTTFFLSNKKSFWKVFLIEEKKRKQLQRVNNKQGKIIFLFRRIDSRRKTPAMLPKNEVLQKVKHLIREVFLSTKASYGNPIKYLWTHRNVAGFFHTCDCPARICIWQSAREDCPPAAWWQSAWIVCLGRWVVCPN